MRDDTVGLTSRNVLRQPLTRKVPIPEVPGLKTSDQTGGNKFVLTFLRLPILLNSIRLFI